MEEVRQYTRVWLIGCMIDEVLKQVSGFDTFKDAQVKLEKAYASKSQAKFIQVKQELPRIKKGKLKGALMITY